MATNKLKLFSQKLDGTPFTFNPHNQRNFELFQEQAVSGCYTVEYKIVPKAKTDEQLGYWYGGIIETCVAELENRGNGVLYSIPHKGKDIPVMVNKDNVDAFLKMIYMVSIGRGGEKFSKGKASSEAMSSLIEWALNYLPEYEKIYIMSSDEYKCLRK